jgi:hypothetical protein
MGIFKAFSTSLLCSRHIWENLAAMFLRVRVVDQRSPDTSNDFTARLCPTHLRITPNIAIRFDLRLPEERGLAFGIRSRVSRVALGEIAINGRFRKMIACKFLLRVPGQPFCQTSYEVPTGRIGEIRERVGFIMSIREQNMGIRISRLRQQHPTSTAYFQICFWFPAHPQTPLFIVYCEA